MDYTYEQIARMIDHSLLNPVMTDRELEDGCRVAVEYDVATVCIKCGVQDDVVDALLRSGVDDGYQRLSQKRLVAAQCGREVHTAGTIERTGRLIGISKISEHPFNAIRLLSGIARDRSDVMAFTCEPCDKATPDVSRCSYNCDRIQFSALPSGNVSGRFSFRR